MKENKFRKQKTKITYQRAKVYIYIFKKIAGEKTMTGQKRLLRNHFCGESN